MNAAAEALDPATRRVVLVVEDEILVRTTIAEFLRDQGYRVVEAANAIEGMDVFASGTTVDLVFTDWQMPGGVNGMAFAQWIDEHHRGVPVLLASGFGYVADWAPLVPPASFFAKPYLAEDVAARIRSLLEHPDQLPK
jgi:DNA-binding NtrC family response regulator